MIDRATSQDLPSIHRLLEVAELPIADVSAEALRSFLVYRSRGGVIGAVGLQRYQDAVLLRSLVVDKSHTGRGIGKELVAAAEQRALGEAMSPIYLLTTTADRFFQTLGFQRLHRDLAPPAIRASHQFASLCPASAVLMVKR